LHASSVRSGRCPLAKCVVFTSFSPLFSPLQRNTRKFSSTPPKGILLLSDKIQYTLEVAASPSANVHSASSRERSNAHSLHCTQSAVDELQRQQRPGPKARKLHCAQCKQTSLAHTADCSQKAAPTRRPRSCCAPLGPRSSTRARVARDFPSEAPR